MYSSLHYWLWLSTRDGLMPQVGRHLYETMNRSIERLYLAGEETLRYFEFSPRVLSSLLDKDLHVAKKISDKCAAMDIKIVTYQDASYPMKLRTLVDPPLVLYYQGKLPLFDHQLSFAMVGARNATPYGVKIALEMAMTLTKAGVIVISGMALGIDSAVVEGALKGGGTLVSVVAGGLDVPSPKESANFYRDVATVGCLISEYPPATPNLPPHYRARNRILTGLSNGVCVVESQASGGSMLSATIAQEQKRNLFAVPGGIHSPNSQGPHLLIQHHKAHLVTNGLDVLEFYQEKFPLLLLHSFHGDLQARIDEATPHVPVQAPKKAKSTRKKQKQPPKPQEEPIAPTDPMDTKEQKAQSGLELVPMSQAKELFTDDQLQLLLCLGEESKRIDALVEGTGLPAKRLLAAVTVLQMKGTLEEVRSGVYRALIRVESS